MRFIAYQDLVDHKDTISAVALEKGVEIKAVFGKLVAGSEHNYPQKRVNFLLEKGGDILSKASFIEAVKALLAKDNIADGTVAATTEGGLKETAKDAVSSLTEEHVTQILDYCDKHSWSDLGAHVKAVQKEEENVLAK